MSVLIGTPIFRSMEAPKNLHFSSDEDEEELVSIKKKPCTHCENCRTPTPSPIIFAKVYNYSPSPVKMKNETSASLCSPRCWKMYDSKKRDTEECKDCSTEGEKLRKQLKIAKDLQYMYNNNYNKNYNKNTR